MRYKSMIDKCNKLFMLGYDSRSLQYHPINNYFDLVNREVQVQEELNNRCDIITKLQEKTADLEKKNKQIDVYIDALEEYNEVIDNRFFDKDEELKEQNKKLHQQLSIMKSFTSNLVKSFTSNLVNRLDEQDKRISSLLAYQKLSDWNTSNSFIITIQRLWRGYFVRKTIKMKVLELKKYLSTLCK